MPSYTPNYRREIVRKVLNEKNKSVDEIALQYEISRATLFRWLKEYGPEVLGGQPTKGNRPHSWTYAAKLQAVLETQHMNEIDLGRYLRRNGLYYSNLLEWKEEILQDNLKAKKHQKELDSEGLLKRIRDLEKELKIKDKALREATALIELKKKAQELWPAQEEDVSPSLNESESKTSSQKRKRKDAD